MYINKIYVNQVAFAQSLADAVGKRRDDPELLSATRKRAHKLLMLARALYKHTDPRQ
jgi:hypothetical protein